VLEKDKRQHKLYSEDDESPTVNFEVFTLFNNGRYKDALRAHSKVLRRRRGNCSSWMADNDLGAVAWIAEAGKINLKVPELYRERPIHIHSTWRLVDKVVESIDKL
jgi:hypothetical protein